MQLIKKTSRVCTDEMNGAVRSKPRLNTWLTDNAKLHPCYLCWDWRSSWPYECGLLQEPEIKNANHRSLILEYLYSESTFKDSLAIAHCSLDISSHCSSILYAANSIHFQWHEHTQQHEQSGKGFSVNKFWRWCWPVRTILTGRTGKRLVSFCTKNSGELPSYL